MSASTPTETGVAGEPIVSAGPQAGTDGQPGAGRNAAVASRGIDDFGRRIDYLRIAITDRCNYRCVYCMPEGGVNLMSHERMLSYEEIVRFVRVATEFGIKHLRLTGGEPLARKGCVELAAMLSALPGIEDIAITTNGPLLPKLAKPLVEAGVSRVNISLDSLDAETFHAVTRVGHLSDALAGIDAALDDEFKRAALDVAPQPVLLLIAQTHGVPPGGRQCALQPGQGVTFPCVQYMPLPRTILTYRISLH